MLATRIAKFDKWALANTKRVVNTSLPHKPGDVENRLAYYLGQIAR